MGFQIMTQLVFSRALLFAIERDVIGHGAARTSVVYWYSSTGSAYYDDSSGH